MAERSIDTWVLGASGYVAAEALRLLAGHPVLRVVAGVSAGNAGRHLEEVFPHLRGAHPELVLSGWEELPARLPGEGPLAVLSALPHGTSAERLDSLLEDAAAAGRELALVDLSADFRLPDPALYQEVYGQPHAAPARLAHFTCALPDLERKVPSGPVAHPGCFTTAVTLACAPLQALGLAEGPFGVSAVTGSTGSGREPSPTTHHPDRHGNLRAYAPLAHRHRPEMEMLLGRVRSPAPRVAFVPHSGPFARGIHATVHVRLREPLDSATLQQELARYHEGSPFVSVGDGPPSLKEVVGTNRCRLSAAVQDRDAVVLSVIDNLTKGAAGGAIQWLNRLLGLPETTGLQAPALGWS